MKNKMATMVEMKAAMGTKVDATIFRKLRQLAICEVIHIAESVTPLQRLSDLKSKSCGPAEAFIFPSVEGNFKYVWLVLSSRVM